MGISFAMASSILDSLRFQNFISASDEVSSSLGYGSTEGKAGVPRYNGDPGRFAEWQFRVRTRQLREKQLDQEEAKKLGPLGLRLLEGLSGHALQVAQLMDIEQLAGGDGAQKLMDHLQLQLRPRREQQARELYEAGAMVGGFLSRQPTETMAQFVLRRRAWYRALTDLSDELKLPDLILAEQLLNNSGISSDQKLMIRTTLSGKVTFEGVAQELVNQHPNIQDRGRFGYRQPDRGHRPSSWSWGRGKGHFSGKQRLAFHQDYDTSALDLEDDGVDYNDPSDDPAAYHGYTYEDEGDVLQYEAGDLAEEGLAMLCEQGLDTEDQEACETAADILQADFEAYWTKKGASSKGRKGFRPPPFEISGSFTLDEKKAKLQQLKARTTCRKCGAVGHWSGDAQCPLSKGKGKTHLARAGAPPSTSSTASSSKAPSRGNPHAGRQPAKSKPRTVYFSIKEHTSTEDGTAFLALRTPDTFNRAPSRSSSCTWTWTAGRVGRSQHELELDWTGACGSGAGLALGHQRR